ncbi:MAG: hypothetical protein K2O39_03845, partial [Clostridiales bacterium]|nr:hypothetical protein [Clostridiales bacterium]
TAYSTDYFFYYTDKSYRKLKEKYGGRFLGHRQLFLRIMDKVNENGKYDVRMEVYGGNLNSEWGNYIFEKNS